MASSATPRHSKKSAPGVTIELDPNGLPVASEPGAPTEPFETASEPLEAKENDGAAAEANPQPAPLSMAATPKPSRASGLFGGLIGGLVVLAGGAGLQWAGVLPSFQNNGELAALKQQISSLSETNATQEIDPAIIEGLTTAQAGLQKNAEAMAVSLSTVEESQRAIVREIASLKSAANVSSGDPAAVTALIDRIAALESGVGALKSTDASAAVAELGARLAALEQNAGNSSGAGAVAKAIAAAGLKAAIDRGGSFASELETYAVVAPASPELEQLKNLAASGVPSKAELTAQFAAAANAMLAASQASDPNAGLLQRLADSARNLVRSRPVGDVKGDTPAAVIARVEIAINRGDLDAALAEAARLPEPAQTAGADYLGKLTARRDADALVTKALTSALSAAGAAQ